MTALEKLKQRGLQFRLNPDGELQVRTRGALTPEVRDEVARCKAEIIATIQTEAANDSAKGGFVHWTNLTPDQRAGIIPTIKGGQPVRIFSEVLGEIVWWARDEQTAEVLKQDPRYQGECVYTLGELRKLAGKSSEFLRDIHRLKKEFGATLARTEPKPVLEVRQ
jgi:hypothetical protein